MKLTPSAKSTLLVALLASVGAVAHAADSPTDTWSSPNSNLLKTGNWSTNAIPGSNVTGVINDAASTNGNVLGLDVSSQTTASIGDLEITGGTNEQIGTYNANAASNINMTLTLLGSTLNGDAHTILANEGSNTSVTVNNDAMPSNKSANSGILTLALGNTSNIIQSSGGNNGITINTVITGSGDSLQFLGSGTGTLVLNATNTFSGGTQVTSGIVVAENASGLGTGAATVNGGTLKTTVSTLSFGGLSLSSGLVALNSSKFNLTSGTSFSMTGGTLDLTAGGTEAIDGGGAGTFSLSGGTLDLGGSAGWNYGATYDILAGFNSGAVSGLTIDDYDSTDFTAHLSSTGVLSFNAVPEPSSWMLGLGAIGLFVALRSYRRTAK